MKASDLMRGRHYPLSVYAIRNGLHHVDVFHSFEKLRKAVPGVKEHARFVMAHPRSGGKPYKSYVLDGMAIDLFMNWMRRDVAIPPDSSKYGADFSGAETDGGMVLGHFGFKADGKDANVRFFLRGDK